MLKEHDIETLLAGGLTEDEIRTRLRKLTPDKLDENSFARCVEQVRAFCAPDFAELAELGINAIDCSGTGGSGRPRFNTSTAAAFVISSAGLRVAKFGNRAATSKSGSFDLLGQMNLTGNIPAAATAKILEAANLVFIFAPQAYPALAGISAIRASLGAATVFNFIGPLLNPFMPAYRVMGVANPLMQRLVAEFVKHSESNRRAIIVRSKCGLDEICPRCSTDVKDVTPDQIESYELPATFAGGDCNAPKYTHTAEENVEIFLRIATGDDRESYEYELLCANAGAGLYAIGKCEDIRAGIELAKRLIADKKVEQQITKLKEAYATYAS